MRGKIVLFTFLLLTGLSECTTSVSEIGSDFFTNKSAFDISYLDSMTLKVSTILRDSMVTSVTNPKRLLVGYHEDEKLGTVTSKSVFQLGVNSAVTLNKSTTEYVGLRLHLKKDGYYFYDTTHSQTFSVYQLTKALASVNTFYYNTSKFSINQNAPLGSLTFFPSPKHTADSLEIPLSDDLGRQLMTMAYNGDSRLATNFDFVRFFRGLALVPDTLTSRAFLGLLQSGSEMRLYYEDRSITPTAVRHVSFPIGSNVYFNAIHSWRIATQLSSLKKANQSVSSNVTDHESYFQCGTGLAMRVEMPYVNTLRYYDPNLTSTRAVLEFMPVKSSYTTNPLPPTLLMYYVDPQNNLLTNAPVLIRLVKDVEYGRNTLYQADVTPFVNAELHSIKPTNNALLILLEDSQYRSTVDRLYVGDQMNQFNMKLRLYYLTLPNQLN